MKNRFSFILLVSMMVSISGCGGGTSSNTVVPEQPYSFTKPTPTNEASIAYYTENDTFSTLADASPYYISNQPTEVPGFIKYDALKQKKVHEAIELSKALIVSVKELQEKLAPFTAAHLDFTATVKEQEKKLNKYALESTAELMGNVMSVQALLASYDSIDVTSQKNPQTKALFEYEKTVHALEAGQYILRELEYLFASSLTLTNVFESSTNDVIKNAVTDFNAQLGQIDSIESNITTVQKNIALVYTALKQLETADYYVAQASLAFMKEKMPEIKTKMGEISPNDTVSSDSITAVQEYATVIEDFAATMEKNVESVDIKNLIQLAELPQNPLPVALVETAYATLAPGDADTLASAYKSLDASAEQQSSTFSKVGGLIKSAGSYTLSGLKGAYNTTTTTIGVGLDTLSAGTKSVFDVGFGLANGNTIKEIAGEIGGNIKQVGKNYTAGTSGSQVLKDAGKFLKDVEDTAGSAAEGGVEYVVGKGWTSWAVGGIAKMTVGMFTGFGKGIYKLADKQATTGEFVEGMMDVGLSLIGGSKVIVKGSQLLSGGKQLGKWSAERAFNFLQQVGTKLEAGQLKSMTAEILKNTKLNANQVLSLIGNSLEMEGKEAIAAELKTIAKTMDEKFVSLVKEGIDTVLKNVKTTPGASFSKWVKTQFEFSIKGLKDALTARLGSSYSEYIDNILASMMNRWIKTAAKQYFDAVLFDGEYKKNFPVGEGISFDIEVIIENGQLRGGIEKTINREGGVATIKLEIEGKTGEKGELVDATWKASLVASGPSSSFDLFGTADKKTCTDNLQAQGSGKVTGGVKDKKKLELNLTGTVSASGTFWCEPIKDATNKPLEEAVKFELDRTTPIPEDPALSGGANGENTPQ